MEVPHVQNVTENVCKKVSKETCVTKMIPEVKAEQTRVCVDVSVTSCQDVLARRCDTPERTENKTVTTTECQPAQQKVSSEQSSGYIPCHSGMNHNSMSPFYFVRVLGGIRGT